MSIYRVLYINGEGVDFHDPGNQEYDDFVRDLIAKLGDSPDEVKAYLVGIPKNPKRRWFIDNICFTEETE